MDGDLHTDGGKGVSKKVVGATHRGVCRRVGMEVGRSKEIEGDFHLW